MSALEAREKCFCPSIKDETGRDCLFFIQQKKTHSCLLSICPSEKEDTHIHYSGSLHTDVTKSEIAEKLDAMWCK